MTETSWVQIIIALLSSGGIIGAIISVLIFAAARMDKSRERLEKEIDAKVSNTADVKRVDLESDLSIQNSLWKMVAEKNNEIRLLKIEVDDIETTSNLSRPRVTAMRKAIRLMRIEIDSMNIMILSEKETNVFMRRFKAVKEYLDEIENSLP